MRSKSHAFLIALLSVFLLCLCTASCESQWVPVTLEGGSGKVTVSSPAEIYTGGSGLTAIIHWSSRNYDYMLVDGVRYDPVSTEHGSVFHIPIPSIECTLSVQADTVAMSEPHLIDYTLVFGAADTQSDEQAAPSAETEAAASITPEGTEIGLQWATGFRIESLGERQWLITIADTDRFLLLSEDAVIPDGISEDIAVLRQPLDAIYLSASGVMDMFISADAMDHLRFSSLKQNDWYLDEAVNAMAEGKLIYAGKYSSPDYELLVAGGCDLAIENMMITHAPKISEELERLGIPVLIDRSSYEATPQGRMEWIKLYGLLTGHYEEACAAFDRQLALMSEAQTEAADGPNVVFFYMTTGGQVSIRCANDYIPKLIGMAGGEYAFAEYGQDASGSSMVIQLEEFCTVAYDADYIIYNSTITGEIRSIDDFCNLCPLFSGMKAVREGHVYGTSRNMYQSSMRMGTLMNDFRAMLLGKTELCFLYPLK